MCVCVCVCARTRMCVCLCVCVHVYIHCINMYIVHVYTDWFSEWFLDLSSQDVEVVCWSCTVHNLQTTTFVNFTHDDFYYSTKL